MKKIIRLLALALISTSADASPVKVDFSGTFSSSITGSGINSGNAFSGNFIFDLQTPNFSNITSNSFEFGYNIQALTTISFNTQTLHLQKINLQVVDDFLLSTSDISKHGLDGFISQDTYDFVSLSAFSDSASDDTSGDLYNGTEINIIALFDATTFDLSSGISPTALLTNLKSNPPTSLFTGVEAIKMDHGSVIYHATNEVADISVSAVPVPATFWLFSSAIAALGIRFRRQH